jgi:glycosyltransferase involved in cell wall biosynthesis
MSPTGIIVPPMRTLVITPMLPAISESDRGGKHRRAGVFLHALARLSDTIEILYLVPENRMGLAEDQISLDHSQSAFWGVDLRVSLLPRAVRRETVLNHYGRGIFDASAQPLLYPYSGVTLIEQIGRRLDTNLGCVFVDRLDAMLPVLCSDRRNNTLLFDMDDLYHKVLLRKLRHDPWRLGKVPLALHLPALIHAERQAVSRSTLSFVCSDADKAHLRWLGFRGAVRVIPNAITPPDDVPGVTQQRTILFLGSQHHGPNRSAAERLVRKIWPIVHAEVTDARLIIAGLDSDTLPSHHAELPGVEYVGFVDDLDGLYAGARVICTPIVHGSGTRLKLVEAAAYGRPIVSTSMGAEGLHFRDDVDILLRETDAELAAACIALLRNDALCRRLGSAARTRMLARYDARAVQCQVEEMIRDAVGTR